MVVKTQRSADAIVDTLSVDGISVNIDCGENSTTITPIDLQKVYGYPNSTEKVLMGKFGSSNPNCPISYSLTKSEEFEVTGLNDSFRIKLRDQFE